MFRQGWVFAGGRHSTAGALASEASKDDGLREVGVTKG